MGYGAMSQRRCRGGGGLRQEPNAARKLTRTARLKCQARVAHPQRQLRRDGLRGARWGRRRAVGYRQRPECSDERNGPRICLRPAWLRGQSVRAPITHLQARRPGSGRFITVISHRASVTRHDSRYTRAAGRRSDDVRVRGGRLQQARVGNSGSQPKQPRQ